MGRVKRSPISLVLPIRDRGVKRKTFVVMVKIRSEEQKDHPGKERIPNP